MAKNKTKQTGKGAASSASKKKTAASKSGKAAAKNSKAASPGSYTGSIINRPKAFGFIITFYKMKIV